MKNKMQSITKGKYGALQSTSVDYYNIRSNVWLPKF